MSTNGQHPQRTISTCRLCGKKFDLPFLNVPLIGQPVNDATMKVVQKMAEHLKDKHPNHMVLCLAASQDMFGLEALKNFTHEDSTLLARMESLRSAFFIVNQRREISDDTLQDRIARLELGAADAAKVLDLCKQMRDFLLEVDLRPKLSPVIGPDGKPVLSPRAN